MVTDDSDDAGDPETREQDELQPDLDILHKYADEHPDVWGGVEFAALTRPARLVAFVTEDVGRHAARLRALVPHPDRLDVQHVVMSARDRDALADQLIERLQATLPAGTFFGVAHAPGATLSVMLASGFDDLARQLVAEYGDVITAEVGMYYQPLSAIEPPGDTATTDNAPLFPLNRKSGAD